ncbi:MAG: ABC transporter permease [Verrucomicrobiales bacterium]|nr:ABC transporter permease [Verrucomicrobiales bacterium]
MNDLKCTFRQLLKNPGFTAVAVLSLTLGIAANTTIFSFVNALLLRPPPVEEPGKLWQVWRCRPQAAEAERYGSWSRVAFAYFRANNRSCAAIAAIDIDATLTSWSYNGNGESVQSAFISGNFFDVCGIRPARGRFFIPAEDQTPGTHPAVVISHGFWQNRLGADPQAVGRVLTINGIALTVIGVAPRSFTGVMAGGSPDLWVPFMMAPAVLHDAEWLTQTTSQSVIGLARLKPEVDASQAATELTVLNHRFDEESRGDHIRGDDAMLFPALLVPGPLRGYVGAFTGILMGSSGRWRSVWCCCWRRRCVFAA